LGVSPGLPKRGDGVQSHDAFCDDMALIARTTIKFGGDARGPAACVGASECPEAFAAIGGVAAHCASALKKPDGAVSKLVLCEDNVVLPVVKDQGTARLCHSSLLQVLAVDQVWRVGLAEGRGAAALGAAVHPLRDVGSLALSEPPWRQ